MAIQKIDTDRIAVAANKLRGVNTAINSAYQTLQSKAGKLDGSWNSRGGDAAVKTLYAMLKNNTQRSAVLQNYINMLNQQINPGYIETEKVNTKLADQFK